MNKVVLSLKDKTFCDPLHICFLIVTGLVSIILHSPRLSTCIYMLYLQLVG
jgi:hypothetical protein